MTEKKQLKASKAKATSKKYVLPAAGIAMAAGAVYGASELWKHRAQVKKRVIHLARPTKEAGS